MTACIKAGVYDNLLKSLKLRTISHPLLQRLPGGQWGVGSGEMRGCTALIQSTPTGLETCRARSSSFSSSTLRGKKKNSMQKTNQYFKILKYLAPRKHKFNSSALLSHFSSRFYTQKGISRLCFSNIYCITEKAKESKPPSLVWFLIASQISLDPKGAEGKQDARKYPSCHFITCKGWGPKKLAACRSVNPVNDISNVAGCCRAKQRGRRGCEGERTGNIELQISIS